MASAAPLPIIPLQPLSCTLKSNTATTSTTSRTYVIHNEGHTLGNVVRRQLNATPNVDFAGYSVPHPSEPLVHLRVQTKGGKLADEAVVEACSEVADICDFLRAEVDNNTQFGREQAIVMRQNTAMGGDGGDGGEDVSESDDDDDE